jgi:hypothetical protein
MYIWGKKLDESEDELLMSKTTQMLSAQSYSLVSQIKCKSSRVLRDVHFPGKMKARQLFPLVGILFLLSLQLVACQIGGNPAPTVPPLAGASTTPSSATPGTTPVATPGTTPVATPGTTPGTDPNAPVAFAGTMSFDGSVKSTTGSTGGSHFMSARSVNSIVVDMPDGNILSMNVTSQTDLSDFGSDLPEVGDRVKVEVLANVDGSFTAAKLSHEQPDDLDKNVITYKGLTTSAVGADDVIHFKVGLKSYSFTIPSSADLKDFNGNAQAIQANQVVNVKVEFKDSEGTVLKVGKASP